jgi:putative transposase
MPRNIQFQNEYYYHICNRGVDKREVFLDQYDYIRFLESSRIFNQEKSVDSLHHFKKKVKRSPTPSGLKESDSLVDILVYCLNSNHFHLLIKQKKEKGISKFMQKVSTGYTNYFNHKYKRSGSLFQGKYKAIEIDSTEGLLKLSVYVNCNAEIHSITKKENWVWSSYLDYINLRSGNLCDKKEVLKDFNSIEEYKIFCEELIPEIKKKDFTKVWYRIININPCFSQNFISDSW